MTPRGDAPPSPPPTPPPLPHLQNVTEAAGEEAACNLAGNVTDCCCTYAGVERVNRDVVKPLMDDLVKTPFFRYFKVRWVLGGGRAL